METSVPKPQKINYTTPDQLTESVIREELAYVLDAFHPDLKGAHIEFQMKHNWSEDAEGNAPLGLAALVGEVSYRQMSAADPESTPPDFIWLLNGQLWPSMDQTQRRFVLDTLAHTCAPKMARGGEQKVDGTGRKLWRKVKPQFAGFSGPLTHFGVDVFPGIKRFSNQVYRACKKSPQREIFDGDSAAEAV